MPLYPYACDECGHRFEALVGSTAVATAVACPECGAREVTRGFGLPARPKTTQDQRLTNCRGDGPPCGASWCGRPKG